jgi:hypothetical protein
MDQVVPEENIQPTETTKTGFLANLKSKLHLYSANYKNLPVSSKRLLSLGMVLMLVAILPILVLTIATTRTNFFNKAASGEPSGEPPSPTPSYCAETKPTIKLLPVTQAGSAGSALKYTVSITNNNSGSCTPVKYSLTAYSKNRNWKASVSNASLTVGSGQTGVTQAIFTSYRASAQGSYTVSVDVKPEGLIPLSTVTATYVVKNSFSTAEPIPVIPVR